MWESHTRVGVPYGIWVTCTHMGWGQTLKYQVQFIHSSYISNLNTVLVRLLELYSWVCVYNNYNGAGGIAELASYNSTF